MQFPGCVTQTAMCITAIPGCATQPGFAVRQTEILVTHPAVQVMQGRLVVTHERRKCLSQPLGVSRAGRDVTRSRLPVERRRLAGTSLLNGERASLFQLLACPEKGFFVPIESESTDSL